MNNHARSAGYSAEIVPGRLYFAVMQEQTGGVPPGTPDGSLVYWLDRDLIYEPFCADFGPCNLAHTWRFCQRVNHLLCEADERRVGVYLCVGPHPHKRANAAALVGIHSVLYLGKRAEEAYAPLRTLEPFAGFRDASCGMPSYTLGVADVIRGIFRAKEVGFINWGAGEALDIEEYEHYEQVENGDLNWIVPGKLMAFSGPSAQPKHYGGWRTFTPEDYVPYFVEKGVTRVVRLNKKMYEAARFTAHGLAHQELYFPDGTCPPEPVLYRFLDLAEREPGALAIHCKAGLGRTGVLICSYMIKHYGFTAEEAMGYIRICRPGSVIGPQQHYLMQYAPRLLHEGRCHRAALAAAAASSPPAPAPPSPGGRRVFDIVATSRVADLTSGAAEATAAAEQMQRLRRSARVAGPPPPAALHRPVKACPADEEPTHMVQVPARHPPRAELSKSLGPAPGVYSIQAQAQDGASTPPRPHSRQAPTSQPPSPAAASHQRHVSDGAVSVEGSSTPPPRPSSASRRAPPSSTKRVLAPNGQPRKIPMAMPFDQAVGSAELEDREVRDAHVLHGSVMDESSAGEDSWTVSSQPAPDSFPAQGGSRMGAFAAAAGRGANVFVEALRSVVGTHRASFNEGRR